MMASLQPKSSALGQKRGRGGEHSDAAIFRQK